MNRIFRETLIAWRKPLIWTVFWLILISAYLLLFSPLGEMARLVLPKTLARDLGTPGGWIGRLGFALVFPIILAGFAARMSSQMVSGQVKSGATPRTWFFANFLALLTALVIFGLVLGLAMAVGNWALKLGMRLDLLPAALLGLVIFGAFFGLLALLIGCLGGSARLSLALVWVVLLLGLGLALPAFLPLSWPGWLASVSPWYALVAQNPLIAGVPLLAVGVLAGLSLLLLLAAWLVFERRRSII